jgi:AcrR family transcriptional regulator
VPAAKKSRKNNKLNSPAKNTVSATRRTNAERTAQTREKVISAAIENIYEMGYEGTSLNSVAARAGVSKGATQHHFPSKAELMVAVAEYCLDLHVKIRGEIFLKYEPGEERISHTAESSWEIINHPSYTAFIEILMATRNNPELAKLCKPLDEHINAEMQRGERAFCRDFDVEPNELLSTLIRTHVTAMRGIAVGMMFYHDRKRFRQELEMMQKYEHLMTQVIIENHRKNKDESSTDKT